MKKKIILSFLLGACMTALLSVFLYLNFVEIRKETTFLELTDTIRSKSLQLRRHEKNYFLYAPEKATDESKAIYTYLNELVDILGGMAPPKTERTASLKNLIGEYRSQFSAIERLVNTVSDESGRLKGSSPAYMKVSRLVESNFLDKPLEDVYYLQDVFSFQSDHEFISSLKELDIEINSLRKTGENILTVSKELDKTARDNVDRFIRMSGIAILIFFPLFGIISFGTILFIISNVVRRLQLLTDVVEKTGHGDFAPMPSSGIRWNTKDEVGTLIQKFNTMEEQLAQRERELLQSKKLAAIGTLASGVAHELNNPLNNIYLSAQVLRKEAGGAFSPFLNETINDIVSQSLRVKRIVGDLLEYARGKELRVSRFELVDMIRNVFEKLKVTVNMSDISFTLKSTREEVFMKADEEQIRRVFINLFTNAVEAMNGRGSISVALSDENRHVKIRVSDAGRGIGPQDLEKIFEPFFTTKDKGTGLGLAIVFNIVKRHNGEIRVESEREKGTTFSIVLPKGD
ncbi:MAG TPA: ATP-binding protein [Thermodesulfovibrionales bacterium]|nr:ATP-binding protein [Thermodesulfovibrionales bacterium]